MPFPQVQLTIFATRLESNKAKTKLRQNLLPPLGVDGEEYSQRKLSIIGQALVKSTGTIKLAGPGAKQVGSQVSEARCRSGEEWTTQAAARL